MVERLHRQGQKVTVWVALFMAGSDVALRYAPIAAESGALVIDNSSAWRMKENVPLVVPEVNPDDIRDNDITFTVAEGEKV